MASTEPIWSSQTIAGRKALILASGDLETLKQKAHDLKGAIRTLELACSLGTFQAIGGEKAEAVTRAIRILAAEAQVLLGAYQDR